jgi:hypothetical protein
MGANSSYPDKRKNESFVRYCQRTHRCAENPPIEYCAYLASVQEITPECTIKLAEEGEKRKREEKARYVNSGSRRDLRKGFLPGTKKKVKLAIDPNFDLPIVQTPDALRVYKERVTPRRA